MLGKSRSTARRTQELTKSSIIKLAAAGITAAVLRKRKSRGNLSLTHSSPKMFLPGFAGKENEQVYTLNTKQNWDTLHFAIRHYSFVV